MSPLRVLITGGEGGLGSALKTAFSAEGHAVQAPGRATLDVRNEQQVADYFSSLERLDVLVANAGIVRDRTLAKLTQAEFDEVLETNLRGVFFCVRAAIKIMVKQRSGHLLLIGSRSAKHGNHGQSNYAAAKAGLTGFAMSVAQEYGARNVRCNVVLPGFLETKITSSVTPERLAVVRAEHTLGRFNTPENAARTIVFLAQLDHVSGQTFTLDSRLDKWT